MAVLQLFWFKQCFYETLLLELRCLLYFKVKVSEFQLITLPHNQVCLSIHPFSLCFSHTTFSVVLCTLSARTWYLFELLHFWPTRLSISNGTFAVPWRISVANSYECQFVDSFQQENFLSSKLSENCSVENSYF